MDRSAGGSAMGLDVTAKFGTKRHGLKLGKSFSRDREKRTAFHTIRYDFKPASIDNSKEAELEVGEKGQVTITLPNVETKGTSCTNFKGSKRASQKECVLIYDHNTGEFTLERLSDLVQVKKQRQEASSRPQLTHRPRSTLDPSSAIPSKTSPNRTSAAGNKKDAPSSSSLPELEQSQQDVSPLQPSPVTQEKADDNDSSSSSSYITDSDSDDSSSSDEESKPKEQKRAAEEEEAPPPPKKVDRCSPSPGAHKSVMRKKPQLEKLKTHQKPPSPSTYVISQLSADLQLSESSDSDSD